MSEQITIYVTNLQSGQRLDKLLADSAPDLSRSRIKNLIKEGTVMRMIDGQAESIDNPSRIVKQDDCYCLTVPEAESSIPEAENIPLDIVFEDDHLIVVNKVAGMVVHPAAGSPNGTLVNALLHHCASSLSGIGGVKRPGIVHRIDKDTSGLLVVAKNDKTHNGLATQFADHSIKRLYSAVIRGAINPNAGRIEGNIARHPKDRKKMALVDSSYGRHAITHYKTLAQYMSGERMVASLVECQLETGRTHQVRVHMAHKNTPLIGDPVYGNPNRLPNSISSGARNALQGFKRQALHARVLGFLHPITKKDLYFESSLPNDMEALLQTLDTTCTRYEIK